MSKEQRNRLIPPTKYVRSIVTGTEQAWQDFLKLRLSAHADIEMYRLADQINTAIQNVTWQYSNYHTPYKLDDIAAIIAKVARVSYNRTKGKNDQALYDSLLEMQHMSVFEHMAIWLDNPHRSVYNREGSRIGWESYRASIENGCMYLFSEYVRNNKNGR